jgi:hypothetical protein
LLEPRHGHSWYIPHPFHLRIPLGSVSASTVLTCALGDTVCAYCEIPALAQPVSYVALDKPYIKLQ